MGFKDNPIVYLTLKTWEFSKGNRKNVILYVLLFLCAHTINFLEPLVIAKVLNIVQEQGISSTSFPTIVMWLASILVLYAGFWIFHGPARVMELKNSFLVRANYKKFLLDGTMNLPAEWHTNHHSGDTIDKIEKGTFALFRYSGHTFEVIEFVTRFVSSYLALAYFNLHSSYIVLFLLVMTITIIIKFDQVLVRYYKKLNFAENEIAAKIYDTISNITTVIILRIEKLLSKAMFRKIMKPLGIFVTSRKISEVKWFLVTMCTGLMTFFVLSSYIYSNLKAGTTVLIGTVYVLYGYVQRINGLFYRFAYKYGEIVKQKTDVHNSEILSNEFRKKKSVKQVSLDRDWNELQVSGLQFTYPDELSDKNKNRKNSPHLDQVSLIIGNKQKIALVGESGSGKTTLLKLIRELYHPQKLKLYLDGKEIKHGFSSISSEFALIPQDPEIFSTTIKENITLGVQHKLDHIKKFTEMARFNSVAERLPHKYNSSIVEKGVNLSGGEKQRLALSRGLLACEDKKIVLLDEPTSSVDPKNELLIYKNIFKSFKNKTIISSVHRLHLLSLFDKVYYFKDGKVVASGSFDELLKKSFEFRLMWKRYNRAQENKL